MSEKTLPRRPAPATGRPPFGHMESLCLRAEPHLGILPCGSLPSAEGQSLTFTGPAIRWLCDPDELTQFSTKPNHALERWRGDGVAGYAGMAWVGSRGFDCCVVGP